MSPPGLWLDENNVLANEMLGLGRGYWYNRIHSNLFTWSETIPYPFVSPGNDDPPQVTKIAPHVPQENEATLTVTAHGTPGEILEVYYQDISLAGSLNPLVNVAAAGIDPLGQTEVTWIDPGAAAGIAIPDGEPSTRFWPGST